MDHFGLGLILYTGASKRERYFESLLLIRLVCVCLRVPVCVCVCLCVSACACVIKYVLEWRLDCRLKTLNVECSPRQPVNNNTH